MLWAIHCVSDSAQVRDMTSPRPRRSWLATHASMSSLTEVTIPMSSSVSLLRMERLRSSLRDRFVKLLVITIDICTESVTLVECFIGKLKQYRRVFSRFDKLDTIYLSFLQFCGTLIWLR